MNLNNWVYFLNKSKLTLLLLLILSISFGICLYPEKPAQLLSSPDQTIVVGSEKSKFNVNDVAPQYRQLRQSEMEPAGYIYRNYTSDGIGPLKIQSNTFTPSKYMSVIVSGFNRSVNGLVKAYIECEKSGDRIGVFNGGVNINMSEALVVTPSKWCSGGVRLIFETSEKEVYVGVGAVYKISPISYWKSSLIGKLPYYFTALFIFSFLMFAGAAIAVRCGWDHDPLPVAFVSLGLASLGMFYLSTVYSGDLGWVGPVAISSVSSVLFCIAGPKAWKATATRLSPYFKLWALVSLVCLAILSLAYNGLGHWEPNYRFWPAAWSTDSELPWLFAEAIRQGWNLRELFGGNWMPTDRPPLMTGALLLLPDAFGWLQINNDGYYLRGAAYNVASVILNTLWAPAVLWLLMKMAGFLNKKQVAGILLFISAIPFVLFNSIYGWPKALGAAFALIAFGLVWQSRSNSSNTVQPKMVVVLFPIVCALSMLAHMSGALFIAPLGILYLLWCFRRALKHGIIGSVLALSLLASWSFYKYAILPSTDPVTKYALTGSFGFGKDLSAWQMLVERYHTIGMGQWFDIKRVMLMQAFLPIENAITSVPLNSDYGANLVDKLRAWDFMLLTMGNSGIVICCALSIWWMFSGDRHKHASVSEQVRPFIALLIISGLTWLMIVLLFIAPPVLHHWPQAAIFGLALGGSVITQYRFPQIFKGLLLALFAYTGIVWIISPLYNALAIDVTAAILLFMLFGATFIYEKGSSFSLKGGASNKTPCPDGAV